MGGEFQSNADFIAQAVGFRAAVENNGNTPALRKNAQDMLTASGVINRPFEGLPGKLFNVVNPDLGAAASGLAEGAGVDAHAHTATYASGHGTGHSHAHGGP